MSNKQHYRFIITNKTSANHLRQSEVIHPPTCTVTQLTKPATLAAGKKVKNVNKTSTSTKVDQHSTLRTENEDTCNSDDFSSFYQTSSDDCK